MHSRTASLQQTHVVLYYLVTDQCRHHRRWGTWPSYSNEAITLLPLIHTTGVTLSFPTHYITTLHCGRTLPFVNCYGRNKPNNMIPPHSTPLPPPSFFMSLFCCCRRRRCCCYYLHLPHSPPVHLLATWLGLLTYNCISRPDLTHCIFTLPISTQAFFPSFLLNVRFFVFCMHHGYV
jgi:hypothetical protein